MRRPGPSGGDRLSHRTEAHADLIRAALAEVPDITLPELKARLAGQGASVSVAALWRYFRRHKITPKIGRTVPLSEAIPALIALETTGLPKGKLIIVPAR